MTTTEKQLDGAIDSTADAAKGAVKDAKKIMHKIGKAIKDEANELANVAGQTLKTMGQEMKDTTKDAPAPKK
jgi:hypothetical protein